MLGGVYTITFFVNLLSDHFWHRTILTASTQLHEHFENDDSIGGMHTMNYYVRDNCVTRIHMYACKGDNAPQEEAGKGQKGLYMNR